jgi:hypothetical protein
VIHAQAKKEAYRQTKLMTDWLKVQEKINAEALADPESTQAIAAGYIRKAKRYQTKIYNENKKLAPLDDEIAMANAMGNKKLEFELGGKKSEILTEQWGLCWKILNIFCAVRSEFTLLQGASIDVDLYTQKDLNYPEDD